MSAPIIDTPYIRQGKDLYGRAKEYEAFGTTEQKQELSTELRAWLMSHAEATAFVPVLIEHVLRKYIDFLEEKAEINYTDVIPIVRNLQKMERRPKVYHPAKTNLYGHAFDTLNNFIQNEKPSKAFKAIIENEWWDAAVFIKAFLPHQKQEFEHHDQFGYLRHDVRRTLPGLIAEPMLMMLTESPWIPPNDEAYSILWDIVYEPIAANKARSHIDEDRDPEWSEASILALIQKMPWATAHAWDYFIEHGDACTANIENAILNMTLPTKPSEYTIKRLIDAKFQADDMDLRAAMLIKTLPENIQLVLKVYTQLYDNADQAMHNWRTLIPVFQEYENRQHVTVDTALLLAD